jgi:hypothetical protein
MIEFASLGMTSENSLLAAETSTSSACHAMPERVDDPRLDGVPALGSEDRAVASGPV